MSKPKIADYVTRVPVTADVEQTISYARGLMHQYKIRHLPILDGDVIVGILSERDLLLLAAVEANSDELLLARAMNGKPYTVDIDSDLRGVARDMCARKIGSAVVTSGTKVVGMFTTTDALGALAAALDE